MRGSIWFCIQRDDSESCPGLCLAAVLQLICKRLLIQQSVELTLCTTVLTPPAVCCWMYYSQLHWDSFFTKTMDNSYEVYSIFYSNCINVVITNLDIEWNVMTVEFTYVPPGLFQHFTHVFLVIVMLL